MKTVEIELKDKSYSFETFTDVIDWNILKKGKTHILYVYFLRNSKRVEKYYALDRVETITSYEKD